MCVVVGGGGGEENDEAIKEKNKDITNTFQKGTKNGERAQLFMQ